MVALNYYYGLSRGQNANPENVVVTSSTNSGPAQGTAADVELRVQINNGATASNITREDVRLLLVTILEFFDGNGAGGAGANLPGL